MFQHHRLPWQMVKLSRPPTSKKINWSDKNKNRNHTHSSVKFNMWIWNFALLTKELLSAFVLETCYDVDLNVFDINTYFHKIKSAWTLFPYLCNVSDSTKTSFLTNFSPYIKIILPESSFKLKVQCSHKVKQRAKTVNKPLVRGREVRSATLSKSINETVAMSSYFHMAKYLKVFSQKELRVFYR